jgi:phospholipase C
MGATNGFATGQTKLVAKFSNYENPKPRERLENYSGARVVMEKFPDDVKAQVGLLYTLPSSNLNL